jgi:hypothetical protein
VTRKPDGWFTVLVACLLGIALAATFVFGPGGLGS